MGVDGGRAGVGGGQHASGTQRPDAPPAAQPPQAPSTPPALHGFAHLDPGALIPGHAPHRVLKLLALAQAVLVQFRLVRDLLGGGLEVLLLQLPRFPQDLFGRDLGGRGGGAGVVGAGDVWAAGRSCPWPRSRAHGGGRRQPWMKKTQTRAKPRAVAVVAAARRRMGAAAGATRRRPHARRRRGRLPRWAWHMTRSIPPERQGAASMAAPRNPAHPRLGRRATECRRRRRSQPVPRPIAQCPASVPTRLRPPPSPAGRPPACCARASHAAAARHGRARTLRRGPWWLVFWGTGRERDDWGGPRRAPRAARCGAGMWLGGLGAPTLAHTEVGWRGAGHWRFPHGGAARLRTRPSGCPDGPRRRQVDGVVGSR